MRLNASAWNYPLRPEPDTLPYRSPFGGREYPNGTSYLVDSFNPPQTRQAIVGSVLGAPFHLQARDCCFPLRIGDANGIDPRLLRPGGLGALEMPKRPECHQARVGEVVSEDGRAPARPDC